MKGISADTVLSAINKKPPKAPSKPFSKAKITMIKLMPYVGLVIVFALFMILTGGELISSKSLDTIISQSAILMVVSVGAVFVYTLGGMDLSIGAAVGVAAIAGAGMVSAVPDINPFIVLIVCVVIGLLTGAFNATLSNILNLPTFLGSLATMSVCSSITSAIIRSLGVSGIRVRSSAWKALDNYWVLLIAIVAVALICYCIYNYTKIGKYARAIGSNRTCAQQSGVKLKKYITFAFMVSGFAIGVAAWLTIIRYKIVSDATGAGLQLDVILAIVIGGMPVTGGARSRISAAVVGSLTLAFLGQGLTLCGVDAMHIQTIRGLLFIIILAITCMKKQHDVLPR